jgi:hypothetical protein
MSWYSIAAMSAAIVFALANLEVPRPWYASPEWWLVILGFTTLFIIGVQTIISGRQTTALVNSERAWIMTEIMWTRDLPSNPQDFQPLRVVQGDGSGGQSTSIDVCLICKNDGRAPAWITKVRMWLVLCYEAPQSKPDTESPSYTHLGPEPLSVGKSSNFRGMLTCSGNFSGLGGPALIVYALVNYRDAFGVHETWCGYNVSEGKSPRLDRMVGFKEYNKNR